MATLETISIFLLFCFIEFFSSKKNIIDLDPIWLKPSKHFLYFSLWLNPSSPYNQSRFFFIRKDAIFYFMLFSVYCIVGGEANRDSPLNENDLIGH